MEAVESVQIDGSVTSEDVEVTYYIMSSVKLFWYALQAGIQGVGFLFHLVCYRRMRPENSKYQVC
jgi:hypothetical protein